MSNRIQRLLYTEYSDFDDVIILESPFAQTTRDGSGIRQLQIGLTPTKLILACDYVEAGDPEIQVDPEIDSLELLSVFPVDAVCLSVFRRKTRNTIKAHFSNDQVLYFELASPERRNMFWGMWCERVKLLGRQPPGSTQSETSVGSSTSTATLYPTHRDLSNSKTWYQRDLYLGPRFGTGTSKKKRRPLGQPHVPREKESPHLLRGPPTAPSTVCLVNRFGAGISENCSTSLFLPAQILVQPDLDGQSIISEISSDPSLGLDPQEAAVLLWEAVDLDRMRHPRRYGILPLPQLLWGLGLWPVSLPQARLLQSREWGSELRLPSLCPETCLRLPHRLLVSSASQDPLRRYNKQYNGMLVFWTPGYWYRPRQLARAYSLLRSHLRSTTAFLAHTGWLRNKLRTDISLTSWDFDSSLIAYQITLLHRDLFVKITTRDLSALLREKNSKNAPNFGAVVAFSNRLANLVASEIIRIASLKMRGRLVARWINVADKLHRLHNLEGVKAVLGGLHSPGVYRLAHTWAYLRLHHATKYRRLARLSRLHRDSRSPDYCRLMTRLSKTPPYLPSAEFLVCTLLGWSRSFLATLMSEEEVVERLLQVWQTSAAEYGLVETPLVKEFLTKARYLEEFDNFFQARDLEPGFF